MFLWINYFNNFKGRMIFSAIFFVLILEKARCQFVHEISMVGCDFDATSCDWRPFDERSEWKISNSTQDTDVPDNGRNFLLLRGTSTKTSVSMTISPLFRILPTKISWKQRTFCSGNPNLALFFSEVASTSLHPLTRMSCPEDESWEETEECSEAEDPESEEFSVGFQIVLAGTVNPGDVIAIQDLRFTDETVVVDVSSTTSSEDDIKNETATDSPTSALPEYNSSITEDYENDTTITSALPEYNSTTTEDYKNDTTITSALPEYNSTTTEDYKNDTTITSSLPEYNSTTTEDYKNDTTITSSLPEYNATKESTTRPISSENTSTEKTLIFNLTDTWNYTDSVSSTAEDIYTENSTFTSSQDFENQTDASSVSLGINTSCSQSEDKNQKSTISTISTEDSTPSVTTDSTNKVLIIQNDIILWKTVFFSALTAFFVYSLLSLLISVIRKLMRRRKRWILGSRSRSPTVSAEDGEVIALSVLNKV